MPSKLFTTRRDGPPHSNLFSVTIIAFVLVVILADPASSQEASINQELKDRLMSGLKYSEEISKNISGRARYEHLYMHPDIEFPNGGTKLAVRIETQMEYSFLGEQSIKEASVKGEVEILKVSNPSYSFVLTRPKGGVYSIAGIIKVGDNRLEDANVRNEIEAAHGRIFAAYQFYLHPVWDLVRDPGFNMARIQSIETDKGERVCVYFSYMPQRETNIGSLAMVIENTCMVFAPQENWKLVGYDLRDADYVFPSTTEGILDPPYLIETIDDAPTDQLAFTKFCGGKNEEYADYSEVKDYSYELVPKEEFYLSFYGFPEPKFGGTHHWGWIALCSVLGGGFLVAARRLLKQRAAA